jgi:hypothetical protein
MRFALSLSIHGAHGMTSGEQSGLEITARPHQPGGPWFVEIRDKSSSAEVFGPYANPATAENVAKRLRERLERHLRAG